MRGRKERTRFIKKQYHEKFKGFRTVPHPVPFSLIAQRKGEERKPPRAGSTPPHGRRRTAHFMREQAKPDPPIGYRFEGVPTIKFDSFYETGVRKEGDSFSPSGSFSAIRNLILIPSAEYISSCSVRKLGSNPLLCRSSVRYRMRKPLSSK